MKRFLTLSLAVLICLLSFTACVQPQEETPAELTLAAEGETDYQIVLPERANRPWEMIAEELQSYLFEITGCQFPIVSETAEARECEIVLGPTGRESEENRIDRDALGKEGFCIRNEGKRIFIVGGGMRGTLYGVYAFLEEYLGVRYYTETFTKIPEQTTLVLATFEDNVQIPAFEFRMEMHQYARESQNERLHLNSQWGGDILPIASGLKYVKNEVCHSFAPLMGWSRSEGYHRQPCLTSDEDYEKMLQTARNWLKEDPNADIFAISPNDSALDDTGECQCENCVAAKEKYGSSGVLINFVNRFAEELGKDYPDLMFETIAYLYTQEAPKGGVVPADNVIVRFCNAAGCMMHSLEGEDPELVGLYPENTKKSYENLKDWAEITEHLYIWDYNIDFGSTLSTIPNFDRLYENIRTYYECGVDGVLIQGMRDAGEFDYLRGYLAAKMLWNPQMEKEEFDAHKEEFLLAYYGEGGEDIGEYLDYLAELCKDTHPSMYHDIVRFWPMKKTEDGKADRSYLNEMMAFWESALEKAKTEEETFHIRRSMLTVNYYETLLCAMDVNNGHAKLSELYALNEALYSDMQTYGIPSVREGYSVPKEPNLNNTVLYWSGGGEAIFDSTTNSAYQQSLSK